MSKAKEELTVAHLTPAKEMRWLREEGAFVRLPVSGWVVKVRTVTPDRLLRLGNMPDVLTSFVVNMVYGKLDRNAVFDFLAPKERAEEAAAMLESLRVVCEASLVHPRLVLEPVADDEISIDDLEVADRGWIFRLAFAPADALLPFRHEPPPVVDSLAEPEAVPQAAE
jgi:hypothetical protein